MDVHDGGPGVVGALALGGDLGGRVGDARALLAGGKDAADCAGNVFRGLTIGY